ncbi:hypothetical protein AZE42_04082 [Rhizopogon vesiculosus]|uniref:Uncharacterized protein n=1 Tax=Rhizopogon vesiculosus TaxID=180088 RepID=A0A1J8PTM5_9AGAM|nr:hypothetical protein AZE42_04082 [Rhizopogon vesiculosus]
MCISLNRHLVLVGFAIPPSVTLRTLHNQTFNWYVDS